MVNSTAAGGVVKALVNGSLLQRKLHRLFSVVA
jgi:hypothetical protein